MKNVNMYVVNIQRNVSCCVLGGFVDKSALTVYLHAQLVIGRFTVEVMQNVIMVKRF